MTVFKCKMCGGTLEVQEGMTVCECEYCGMKQTLPKLDSDKKLIYMTARIILGETMTMIRQQESMSRS